MTQAPFSKTTRRTLFWLTLLLSSPSWAAGSKLNVVASFSILADMAREVGGPDVQITSLVGADGDAHVFEPTPQHARILQQAAVVVSNGLGFEGWMQRLKKSSGFKGIEVVASQGVEVRNFEPSGHDQGDKGSQAPSHSHANPNAHSKQQDPHAWQSAANAVIYARNMADGFATADPANAAAYRTRALAYADRLKSLDTTIRQAFAALPPERRVLVTTHDAFGYFAQAYGLRILPARGISTESEPSASDIARLIDQVRKQRIRAVFIENISDPRLIEQLARETGAVVGGRLYSDALSASDGPASTYFRLMEVNTQTLLKALQP